jgi:hypothetical protein
MSKHYSLIIANIIMIIGLLFNLFDFTENILAIGRFIYGFAALGMCSVIVPKYIEETVPIKYKA